MDKLNQYYEWISLLNARQETAPEGRLKINKSNGVFQFHHVTENQNRYLDQTQTELIKALAQKGYDQKALPVLKRLIAQEERRKSQLGESALADIFAAMSPERQALVEPLVLPVEEKARRWAAEPFESKGFKEGDPEHFAKNGLRVRSKSERDTVNELLDADLLFKYECPLQLRGLGLIHPDFMVMNRRTGQVFVWEHFGMVDERSYAQDMVKRIEAYHFNGYYEGKNFIYTMETQRTPFGPKDARRIIEQYLL